MATIDQLSDLFTIFKEEPATTQQPASTDISFEFPRREGYERKLSRPMMAMRARYASARTSMPHQSTTMDPTNPATGPNAEPTLDPSKSGEGKGKAPQKHTGSDSGTHGSSTPSATPASSASSSSPSDLLEHYYRADLGWGSGIAECMSEFKNHFTDIGAPLPEPDFTAVSTSEPASISPSLSRAPASWNNHSPRQLQSSPSQLPNHTAYRDITSRQAALEFLEEYREDQRMSGFVITYLRKFFATTEDFDKLEKVPKFGKFLELPLELRKRIYEIALCTGKEIHPILCDRQRNGSIKFHDENGHSRKNPNHNAVSKLLGVTRTSKQLREESLPCFYSANTITDTKDVTTYFAYLSHLNRFHMIRHVRLTIPLLTERWAAQLLVQMNTYVKDVEKYDTKHATSGTKFTRTYLVNHPRYIAGGLDSMNLFIVLRMLTSTYPSNTDGYTSSLTLPVPSIASFTTYQCLRYFPLVCHGLGMHVRYLEGHEVVQNKVRNITIDWQQKFQKKWFGAGEEGKVDVDVRKRTLEMFPDVDGREFRVNNTQYYRTNCDGETLEWWKVQHHGEGSGVVE
ncbi:hypothetical protein HBH56_032610 [Parastagonospora nodorum]|nr:hypothetical protein HBH56_032610 [Parastagonospora nodorum]KAH3933778.1 hypothetical protein HBH54_066830 [Parastagonospora nodorum]KAH4174751.1 hypothetical protein HBH44_000870 [Parastagonospora nodorum]KAH4577027.1 hypothetical protein HBH84_062380 [Parastagonospora nodorum]KAH4639005.1 hypothetical protein HBH55_030580 [Parastagonospora nodorum]